MKTYKKMNRVRGVYYGGQGFSNDERIFSDWYDEDSPILEVEVQKIKKQYSMFTLYLDSKYAEIEN